MVEGGETEREGVKEGGGEGEKDGEGGRAGGREGGLRLHIRQLHFVREGALVGCGGEDVVECLHHDAFLPPLAVGQSVRLARACLPVAHDARLVALHRTFGH